MAAMPTARLILIHKHTSKQKATSQTRHITQTTTLDFGSVPEICEGPTQAPGFSGGLFVPASPKGIPEARAEGAGPIQRSLAPGRGALRSPGSWVFPPRRAGAGRSFPRAVRAGARRLRPAGSVSPRRHQVHVSLRRWQLRCVATRTGRVGVEATALGRAAFRGAAKSVGRRSRPAEGRACRGGAGRGRRSLRPVRRVEDAIWLPVVLGERVSVRVNWAIQKGTVVLERYSVAPRADRPLRRRLVASQVCVQLVAGRCKHRDALRKPARETLAADLQPNA